VAGATEPRRFPRRAFAYFIALGGTLLVATVSAIGSGLGSRLLDAFDSASPPALISSSATEQVYECGTTVFIPDPEAEKIAAGPVPSGKDWVSFYREHGAVPVGRSESLVSIQGETTRPITLTGINFEVDRRQRPAGRGFSLPCGGPGQGRFLVVDVDRDPPRIVASSEDPKATMDPTSVSPKPIKFPWLVSVTDPLLLTIVAVAERCRCTWRASIPWRSGSKSGEIAIDNGGKGFAVAGDKGLRRYAGSGPKWTEFTVP
jgi:hypothetical protein